ncbi:type VI secretion lipoprotein TssJ [Tatumella sp. UCD-D_suzukii]|uniref:type VI secretion lipoprotein TssJ n=1 Tax=Tatumella sp. UCD-D_suzukii TaxID=1408192 RepID=UPI00047036AF|nr:type VI secretion lipoprotein TssJ [Tatumella sp. UCD-D_suzukii]
MNVVRQSVVLFVTGVLLSGCPGYQGSQTVSVKQQAVDQMNAPFAQGAITLNITAEPGLNSWNEIANSCTVLVIQAKKASSLNKILSNPAQLKSLFSGAGAEDDILKVDRYPAMPGQRTTLHIDRSENTREVAIVAGYYPFPKKQHMAIVSVPVTLNSTGWWNKIWTASLSPLTLNVTLGSQSITQLTTNSSAQDVVQPANAWRAQTPSETAPAKGDK